MDPDEIIARVFDGFSRGDLAAIQDAVSPEIELHMPGANRLAGDYRGIGAVLALVARAASVFDPSTVTVLGFDAEEGMLTVRVSVAAGWLASGRGAVELTQRMALGTDGRIVRCRVEPDDPAEWDELVGGLIDGGA
jgi:ketosteroid isomerase-like protein